jgi:hypothetical protein
MVKTGTEEVGVAEEEEGVRLAEEDGVRLAELLAEPLAELVRAWRFW